MQSRIRQIITERTGEADCLKLEFLHNTTHEFRTPLTAIMGYSNLLIDGKFGALTQVQRKAIERLMVSTHGLFSLVEQIFDYSKLEKGEIGFSILREDVRPLLDQLRRELAPLESGKPYKVQYEIKEGLPPIETDWGKLKSILFNILSNAIKFTDEGKVELSVMNRSINEVSFTVSDTGIGIPKEKISLIFEKFRQLDGSQTRRYAGAGLGLAISKNLAELIGGKIEVKSAVGQGSTFRVIIPVTGQLKTNAVPALPVSLLSHSI
ncbi:MAG: HAMP domain-containing sensor histidine kinase [Deltaproteobacteria bacterium]|nr:HAMP domain-containing sensor histidine kinase [Deltaproteobacteria bacterium]